MYYAMYGDEYLYDPVNPDRQLSELKISCTLNESGSCTFVVPPNNKCYDSLVLRDLKNELFVYSDDTVLFDGFVYSVSINLDLTMEVEAKGCLAYLGDTILRPYSTYTDPDEGYAKVSSEPAKLFEYYIQKHNENCGESKGFIIGTNEASSLVSSNTIYRESGAYPTTANELTEKMLESIGGYIFVRHANGKRYIDYLANCNDVNAQTIDFGVNLLDFIIDSSTEELYTAIRPTGATVSTSSTDSDGNAVTNETIIDISSIPDGTMYEGHYIKSGDRILYLPSVEKYGIIEEYYSDEDCTTASGLAMSAVKELKSSITPSETLEIKALDLSLLSDNYTPLVPGNLVRVRSTPHNYDSYLLVTGIDIDIYDPSNSTYTLGGVKNTYTGIENAKIKSLNESVDANYDTVLSLSDDVKQSAIAIDNVTSIANSKRRVFVGEPTPPYDVGDLWVKEETDDDGKTKTVVMVCTTAKEE